MVGDKQCEYCFAPVKHLCANCHLASYCSSQHQVLLWKYHRLQCSTDNSIMFKSPALQSIERPYLKSVLHESIRRMGGTAILNFLLKPDVDLVAFTNSQHTTKTPATKASITLWNRAMDQYRSNMHPYITEAYPSGSLLSGSGLSPYYLCNIVFGHIKGSTCIYYHPLFLAYFQYHTLSDIIMQQGQATDANNYLMESIKKLELLTEEAEKKGMDKGLLYRNEFEVTKLHAQRLFSIATGVDNDLSGNWIRSIIDC